METISCGSGLDRISDLPRNVIDHILSFLPLRDAVRTCALSKQWKEKWRTMPNVVIDEEMFAYGRRWLDGFVNYVMTTHEGRIEKFSVSMEVRFFYNMKSWLWKLSRDGVKELFLLYRRGRYSSVPSSLFSCRQLKTLSLRRCTVYPPRSFTGFQCLISLKLDKVDINAAAFERFISSCPLLEKLTLRKLLQVDYLNIYVPKLKYFCFDGEFTYMCFNTPLLEVFSFNFHPICLYMDENKFQLRYKFCGLPPAIKELYVRCDFQKYLDACETIADVIKYSHLRILELDQFCFKKVDQVRCLVSLLGRASKLTLLHINACGCKSKAVMEPVTKFWEKQNSCPVILDQLQKVRIGSFHGEDVEMKLIQFVMLNSPALEEITIESVENPGFDKVEVESVLQHSCKASTLLDFIVRYTENSSNRLDYSDHLDYSNDPCGSETNDESE